MMSSIYISPSSVCRKYVTHLRPKVAKEGPEASDCVFLTERGTQMANIEGAMSLFNEFAKAALGVECKFTSHEIRYFIATLAACSDDTEHKEKSHILMNHVRPDNLCVQLVGFILSLPCHDADVHLLFSPRECRRGSTTWCTTRMP